jgi:hypothetical protein
MEEKRQETRKRTLRSAKIVYGDYRYVIDCLIREHSESGVRVKLLGEGEIPTECHLFDSNDRSIRRVSIAWRKEQELGLHFEGEPVLVHEAADPRLARFRYM